MSITPDSQCVGILKLLYPTPLHQRGQRENEQKPRKCEFGLSSQGHGAWHTYLHRWGLGFKVNYMDFHSIICSNHLNGGLKTGQKIMFYGKNVYFSNGQTIWKPDKKCLKSQMFGFQVFGIQMGTVMGIEYLIWQKSTFGASSSAENLRLRSAKCHEMELLMTESPMI